MHWLVRTRDHPEVMASARTKHSAWSETEDEEEDEAGEDEGAEEAEAEAEADDWSASQLVYAHLPPSQRQRDQAARRRRPPPKAYASRNFYQVVPMSEILFSVPVFPADVWEIEDPDCLLISEHGWGM